ncbi:MAG: flagellar basal body L-ring protein FlgH [Phycisphaeraceae bacterium]|nr:flagellar basal body L-ring protein FlgH [Phycisphaerales bacterium]MCB9859072.1 flagellar basal body L-ring protein FlgH [Phycisphaeraceae bacterium]
MKKLFAILTVFAGTTCASAQSLFERTNTTQHFGSGVSGDLFVMGLHSVRKDEARIYGMHDLVQIIINESSKSDSSQSLTTNKDYSSDATINAFIDLAKLAELQLREGNIDGVDLLDVQGGHAFKGDGKTSRSDRIVDRVTATVIDVKPNGTLLLEARVVRGVGDEVKTLVLSGLCRREDITAQGTILSNQMANLTLFITHEGELAKSGEKGIIPRALESLFAF